MPLVSCITHTMPASDESVNIFPATEKSLSPVLAMLWSKPTTTYPPQPPSERYLPSVRRFSA